MKLTDDERRMLDGAHGLAKQKAMDLLVRYGEALGAERLVDTRNVCGTTGASTPFLKEYAAKFGGYDAVFSEFNLDSPQLVKDARAEVFTCQLIQGLDCDHWQVLGSTLEAVAHYKDSERRDVKLGIQLTNTCAPYLLGNVPVKGEHCAWMESSAVVYCNSVLGARTNTEGRESAGAAMLTGKIPYWGYHIGRNRRGTHLVELACDVEETMDWGLLGYYVGEMVEDEVPIISGVRSTPTLPKLKHFGAAAASSGGVEMYHIVGVTPEAATLAEALGGAKSRAQLAYGPAERRAAYEKLNATAHDTDVDYVMLGCPHYSIDQLWEACRLLEGKRVHDGTSLWIFAPRAIRQLADKNGLTDVIRAAGGWLMSDTCSAVGQFLPKGCRVVATDSAKQAHYLPAIMGVQAWFGSTRDCIEAAIRGRWQGGTLT